MHTKNTRETILAAAQQRFGHYGFAKTTMAEIASDCQMSAANIYRHFKGKNDILAILATGIFRHQESSLAEIVADTTLHPKEKLYQFFQTGLSITQRYVSDQPKMKEMVDYICKERFDLVQVHSDTKRDLIAAILQEGVERGDFFIADVPLTALAFKGATVMFHTPIFMDSKLCPEDLSLSCTAILDLLISAISSSSHNR